MRVDSETFRVHTRYYKSHLVVKTGSAPVSNLAGRRKTSTPKAFSPVKCRQMAWSAELSTGCPVIFSARPLQGQLRLAGGGGDPHKKQQRGCAVWLTCDWCGRKTHVKEIQRPKHYGPFLSEIADEELPTSIERAAHLLETRAGLKGARE